MILDFAGVSPWRDSAMVLLAVYAPVVIVVTETARALAREVVYPRTFAVARPLVWLMRLAAIGLLPPAIREAYGFPWDSHREQALRRSIWPGLSKRSRIPKRRESLWNTGKNENKREMVRCCVYYFPSFI
jgi:uncharacterized protein (DUF2236 family)